MSETFLVTGATGLVGFRALTTILAAGHNARFAVRSEAKAKAVLSNPAVQKLSPGDRLSSVIIPDMSIEGAFDEAMKGITRVIHIASPLPHPHFDPMQDIYLPTVQVVQRILTAAVTSASVKRVVITSSIIASHGLAPDSNTVYNSTKWLPRPDSEPKAFDNTFIAYITAKVVTLYQTEQFIEKHKPHFTVAFTLPGCIVGRNELVTDVETLFTGNSSNGWLLMGITGKDSPAPLPSNCIHLQDVVDVTLKVAMLDPTADTPKHFGISYDISALNQCQEVIAKHYPKALDRGVFARGNFQSFPIRWDSSETEKTLGIKFRSYESAVREVADQYLEMLGEEKA